MNVSKPRDGRRTGDVGLRRKAAVLGSVIALVALVVGSFFGDRGILQMWTQRERTQALAREVQDLRAQNAQLSEEIRALRSDPRAVERLAREQLGLARPGEMVFLLASTSEPARRP